MIAKGKTDEDEETRLASWMADGLLNERSFLGSSEYESIKSTCPEFSKRLIEFSEFVDKIDPDLPPNIAFLHLEDREKVFPSMRKIDVFPVLNIRKGKGVAETRDERLSKYREAKDVVPVRVKPPPLNALPKKRSG